MKEYVCSVCGYVHKTDGELPDDFTCPVCKQPANKFVKIEDAPTKNPYAGTKTEKNLWEAFAGESQARNKYTYFASVAKKAGYHPNASPLKIITEQLANKANILRNNRKSCEMNQHLFKKL